MSQHNQKIIYLIGAGRSGTTLLDIMIGNAEGIESCGELNRYPRRKGVPPMYDKSTKQALFWEYVCTKLDVNQKGFNQVEKINDKFEYHIGFIKRVFKIQNTNILERYQIFQSNLFQSIFDTLPNHKKIIVDSSKYPGRAVMLSNFLPYEIVYVYIKRDPVSVVQSFSKKDVEQPPKGWFAANIYYAVVNTLCFIAVNKLKRKHKVVTVTYEDMVNQPIKMLSEIEKTLDIDLKSVIYKIKSNIPLSVGMLFDGNRIRLKDEIVVQPSKSVKLRSIKDFIARYIQFFLYKP